jgi:hypothetical protein
MTAGRIRRAWAVLLGRNDPAAGSIVTIDTATGEPLPPGSKGRVLAGGEAIEAAKKMAAELRSITSLRASLDDHTATIARLSAEAKRRNDLTREAHALLGRAITDDGVPQP